jgi:hypothetical protein
MTSGITEHRQLEKIVLYEEIFNKYSTTTLTLQELGKKYGLTKQRISQIVIRCQMGDGDYYRGGDLAKENWKLLSRKYTGDELVDQYKKWLKRFPIKIAKNNRKFTLLIGRTNA